MPARLRVASIYLPNGNPIGTDKFKYKLSFFERLDRHAKALLDSETPSVLAGDWNVCPTDEDVWDPAAMAKDALCQPESRAAFRKLLYQGWTDAIRAIHPNERSYTYWDYFQNRYERLFTIARQSRPVRLRTPIKRLSHALHVFGHGKIADPHFAQITVHVRTEMIEERLPEFPQLRFIGQSVENQGQMQNQQVKTSVYSVGHPIFAIKAGQSRLRHDRAIQGRNGVRPRAAAK